MSLIEVNFDQLIKRYSCHHIETSQWICKANGNGNGNFDV